MGFPLRFTAGLQLGLIACEMQLRGHDPTVLRLQPYSGGSAETLPSVRSTQRMVWIGGSNPLEHPHIPKFANVLALAGREVFLQTDGTLLRRRLHEFRPSSRMRFVFGFDGTAPTHSDIALEAIYAAKLSGFLICALTILREPQDVDGLAKFHAELHKLDLDGYLIAPGAASPEVRYAVAEARRHLLNRRWRRLSAMLGSVTLPEIGRLRASHDEPPFRENPTLADESLSGQASRGNCEEGAQA
jgi:hypothetical protein